MDGVIDRLKEAAERVLPEAPVLFAYVFGSVARGDSSRHSDIDVAVYVDPAIRRDALDLSLDIADRLEEAARAGDIEVVILNDAPLRLAGRAIQERIVVYSRDESARVAYESLTLREFLDFEMHARSLDEQFLRDLAAGRR
jgi:predicted nucleotidyltransferase